MYECKGDVPMIIHAAFFFSAHGECFQRRHQHRESRRKSNLDLPFVQWTELSLVEHSNGIWRYFDDGTITNRPARYYRPEQQQPQTGLGLHEGVGAQRRPLSVS
jgi:hypothetical protein